MKATGPRLLIAVAALGGLGCSGSSAQHSADAGTDRAAPPKEAGATDRKVPPPPDGGADVGVPPPLDAGEGGCAPAQVSGFVPVAVLPITVQSCTLTEIRSVIASCLDPSTATEAACTSFGNASMGCYDCVYTSYGTGPIVLGHDPVPPAYGIWGPEELVSNAKYRGLGFPNVGACVQLVDPSMTECAEALQNVFQCQMQACAANCVMPGGNDTVAEATAHQNAFDGCMLQATDNGCSYYALAATADCAKAGTGPTSICFDFGSSDPATFDDAFMKLIELECGILDEGGAADAGVPDVGGGSGGG
jgi:hypothetical protein